MCAVPRNPPPADAQQSRQVSGQLLFAGRPCLGTPQDCLIHPGLSYNCFVYIRGCLRHPRLCLRHCQNTVLWPNTNSNVEARFDCQPRISHKNKFSNNFQTRSQRSKAPILSPSMIPRKIIAEWSLSFWVGAGKGRPKTFVQVAG